MEREPQLGELRGDAGPAPADGGNRDAAMDATAPDGGEPPSLLDAPEADRLAEITLDEPVERVVVAGEHTFALHAENSATLLDLSDPTAPALLSRLTTTARIVDIAYDPERQIAFALTAPGELRAFRVSDASDVQELGFTQISPRGGAPWDFVALARVRDRLFLLADAHIAPVHVGIESDGSVRLEGLTPLAIDSGAQRIAESGTGFFVGFSGGIVRTFSADAAPIALDEVSLGAEIASWSVRGERVLVALEGSGVREVALRPGKRVQVLLRASELDDSIALARNGQLAAVALERDVIVALDVSDASAPRALVKHEAGAPGWLAVAGGNVLFGQDSSLTVLGVPPFVEAGVAPVRNEKFPRAGRIALQLSKAIDPESVTLESIVLECDRMLATTRATVSLDGRRIDVAPTRTLPASAHCILELSGVRDALEMELTSQAAWLDLTTLEAEPAVIENNASGYAHTLDGRMSDWASDKEAGFEYTDLAAAAGMHGDLYADYDGERLWLFYDALDGTAALPPSCFAVMSGFAADGDVIFAARMFGDGRAQIVVGGDDVEASYGFGGTRGSATSHGALELSVLTAEGEYGVQVHMPSQAADCALRQAEPIAFFGACTADGCSADATRPPDAPVPAASLEPTGEIVTLTPFLKWRNPDLRSLPRYHVTIADDDDHVMYRSIAYGAQLRVPAGLLEMERSYGFTVQAESPGGAAAVSSSVFTVVPDEPPPAACAHSQCLPGSVLRADCAQCVEAVCSIEATCCTSGNLWDADCIALAEASVGCDCSGAAITGVEPAGGVEGTDTAIEVALTDSDENLEHSVVITLAGGGSPTTVPCTASEDACSATFPGALPAGTYDITLRIRESGATYFSAPLTDAFVQDPVTP